MLGSRIRHITDLFIILVLLLKQFNFIYIFNTPSQLALLSTIMKIIKKSK